MQRLKNYSLYIIVVIALAIALGVVYYTRTEVESPLLTATSTPPSDTLEPISFPPVKDYVAPPLTYINLSPEKLDELPLPKELEGVELVTYKESKSGVSFKYPKGWLVYEEAKDSPEWKWDPTTTAIVKVEPVKNDFAPGEMISTELLHIATLNRTKESVIDEIRAGKNSFIFMQQYAPYTLNGVQGIYDAGGAWGDGNFTDGIFYLFSDAKTFFVRFHTDSEFMKISPDVALYILSTLRFE